MLFKMVQQKIENNIENITRFDNLYEPYYCSRDVEIVVKNFYCLADAEAEAA